MQTQKLNYEIRLFNDKDQIVADFEFHGESAELATDHAQHVVNSHDTAVLAHYRKIGAVKWKAVKAYDFWVLRRQKPAINKPNKVDISKRTEGELYIPEHSANNGLRIMSFDGIQKTHIADCFSIASGIPQEQAEANAAFMVLAWNNHDKLVEALNNILKTGHDFDNDAIKVNWGYYIAAKELLQSIEQQTK